MRRISLTAEAKEALKKLASTGSLSVSVSVPPDLGSCGRKTECRPLAPSDIEDNLQSFQQALGPGEKLGICPEGGDHCWEGPDISARWCTKCKKVEGPPAFADLGDGKGILIPASTLSDEGEEGELKRALFVGPLVNP